MDSSTHEQIVELVAQMDSTEPPSPQDATPEAVDAAPEVAPEAAALAAETVEPAAADPAAAQADQADPALERSWQATVKKEKALLELQRELKAQRAELDAAKPQAPADPNQIDINALREDPLALLKKHGIHFDDLAKRVLSGKASPEEVARRAGEKSNSRIEQLEARIEDMQKQATERSNAQMVSEYQAGIKSVMSDPEFELLSAYPDGAALVFNLASTHASQEGTVLTPADAARRIQGELKEQLSSLSKSAAVRKLLGLQDAPAESQTETETSQSQSGPRTLTNALAATPASESPDLSQLSDYEQILQAAKLVPDTAW